MNAHLKGIIMNKTGKIFRGSTNESELNEKEKHLIAHYRKMSSDTQATFDVSFRILSDTQN